ncbi:hypothetical protein IW492_02930 [Enterococcus sp. BWB1-3]|uniref:hypothetical protein n=1 Tax=Enterococcus sp. BWB1-3 TaxID=2787713 RepID=UPI001921B5C9|nr:hypothetical protein [Enterococcus sp. BWB1-3]MBL1228186.1 hypothetical protein [Enterococcus sp. BWB1-3]
MLNDSSVIRFSCRLMLQKQEIINRMKTKKRLLTEAEETQIQWINKKMEMLYLIRFQGGN